MHCYSFQISHRLCLANHLSHITWQTVPKARFLNIEVSVAKTGKMCPANTGHVFRDIGLRTFGNIRSTSLIGSGTI